MNIDFVDKSVMSDPNDDVMEPMVDFGQVEDKTKGIIKVIGVGGGGCNAVRNMYNEGIVDVSFAVCNTDSKSLSHSPVPVKVPMGYLGAGGNPEEGRKATQEHIEDIKRLLNDGTKMAFVTAGMGGGTGTGAASIIAGIAKSMGILTIGIVTIPFYFEKKRKIIKALKGVEEMRKNVDAILIVNNERICDIYSDSKVTIKESFARADQILSNATKSMSELITIEGDVNLDFKDVESTMRSGGGAIMAMGRASGERRVEKAIVDALDSPLLYGNDISKVKRILFNISTSEKAPLFVDEMNEVDAFMDALNPDIDVIWGVSDDNTLEEDAKVTILATGFDDEFDSGTLIKDNREHEEEFYTALISRLYKPIVKRNWNFVNQSDESYGEQPVSEDIVVGSVVVNGGDEENEENEESEETKEAKETEEVKENVPVDNVSEDDEESNVAEDDVSEKQSVATHKPSLLDKLKGRLEKMGFLSVFDEE